MTRVFVDTSAWFDHLDRDARRHKLIKDALEDQEHLYTSDYIVDETLTLIRKKLGHPAAVMIGSAFFTGSIAQILEVSPQDREEAWDLFRRRSDKPYSFTDCTSFVLMKRLGLETVISSDNDFMKEGFSVIPDSS